MSVPSLKIIASEMAIHKNKVNSLLKLLGCHTRQAKKLQHQNA